MRPEAKKSPGRWTVLSNSANSAQIPGIAISFRPRRRREYHGMLRLHAQSAAVKSLWMGNQTWSLAPTTHPSWLRDRSPLPPPLRPFYLLVGSTGVSEPPPAAEPRLGRRTALTFPPFPPPQKN